ncbi:RrF2 family transcriptional regulator [Natranaerofaba carboxydovora]|uniref:RrF2 family transcriptional regulator n=1 Tax=Natranaerofaba carboxydovora TaxID=2742683 RepID=UPI001F13FEAF|nr:Rrf2 family transcriptional regulator [Natranaerofaba carboxydovora]UMZ73235.1 HTH-type transcriptional regulator CymR [Natranaerofaba carboxydovora]
MKLTLRSYWAVKFLLYLAINFEEGIVPLKKASNVLGISEKYLEQLVIPLKKENLIRSSRGASGGYQLNRPPGKISVWEIVAPFETSDAFVEKNSEAKKEEEKDPEIRQVVEEMYYDLQEEMKKSLEKLDLNKLCEDYQNKKQDGFMYYI